MFKKKEKETEQVKCSYPGCENEDIQGVSLPVGRMTDTGIVYDKEESKTVSVPLCNYHFVMAEEGIFALINRDNNLELIAPFDAVRICEAVFDAKELKKETEEYKKGLEKDDKES